MNDFFFQEIQVKHSDQIFILQTKYSEEFGNNIWRKQELQRTIIQRNFKGRVYIVNKKICGFCFFKIIDDYIEIYSLFVDPCYRQRGVAACFISQCIEFCKKKKLQKIILDVNETNFKAINFYRKSNFTFCGKRRNYYRIQDKFNDSYTMHLLLNN